MNTTRGVRRAVAAMACAAALFLALAPPARAQVPQRAPRWITTDHSMHEALKKPFASPEEVTKACLSCHNQAALQVHKTIHWTWLCPMAPEGSGLGKGGLVVNNFCVAVKSNEPRCTSCHAGYGWKDGTFDFTSEEKVDCLVCHDSTGSYKKFPPGAGYPVMQPTQFGGKEWLPPDLNNIAQKVRRPGRANCGACHFTGGGGDGVKHGDLDTSLLKPSKDLDVHMAQDGANFTCVRCHTTEAHKISGRCYKTPASNTRMSLLQDDQMHKITCESCHSATPHKNGHKANDHTDKVACQTCHIPEFAREKPTKMSWDWSTAGKKKDGKPFTIEGPYGKDSYDTMKGDFVWKKNVQPEYLWFNGSMGNVLATDKIDPSKPVELNLVYGSRDDKNSRIYPFKVHTGKTPYDTELKTMVIPHLFGKDDAAYWKTYDWDKAIAAGQEASGLPYSGKYGFADTIWYFQTTHMVAPKEKALKCGACHAREGRLAKLGGFYMPGRDHASVVDFAGWGGAALALIGVLIHGLMRLVSGGRRKEG